MGIVKNLLFGKYLVLTNTVSCGLMMGVGDMLQQKSETWKKKFLNDTTDDDDSELVVTQRSNEDDSQRRPILPNLADRQVPEGSLDSVRIRNMIAVGTLQGPFHHYFYAVLDKVLPGKSTGCIIKKTLLDQSIASPTCLGIFFFGHGFLEQKQRDEMLEEIKAKFLRTYKVDCCFWPPAQAINFLLVPVQYRVIYVNVMNIIYDIFLSYAKYDAE